MFNHRRGLWGYSGMAADSQLLTIQSTGMGGPSAAIVSEELIALGARRLIRIGTCGALVDDLELGAIVAPRAVLPADGASIALGAAEPIHPDPRLLAGLLAAGALPVSAASSDLFYDPREDVGAQWTGKGVQVVEMEAATILRVAQRAGVDAACVLAVSDVPAAEGARRASDGQLEELGVRVGRTAYAALTAA